MKTFTSKVPGNAKTRMNKLHYTSKIVGIRKSKLINQKAVPQWKPVSGCEDFYKPVGSIELRIEKFAEFAESEETAHSDLTYIRGLPWQIYAYPTGMDNQEEQSSPNALSLFLGCKNESTDSAWNCQVKNVYRVVSQTEDADDFEQFAFDPSIYNADDADRGYAPLITIEKLLDPKNGYIKDDTVVLQVDVTSMVVYEQDDEDRDKAFNDTFGSIDKYQLFSSSTNYPWDFVLFVQGNRVHVQKNILSLVSEYFKEQFAKYKNIKRAVLQNVDYNEFIELLSVISPTSYPVTVKNVERVAKLAHIFKVRGVLRQCEAVLMMNSSKFGVFRPFLMSHWYGMEHWQAKCVDELKAIDPRKLKEEPDFTALDCRAKAILLDKIVESNPVVSLATNHMKTSSAVLKARVSEILDKLTSSAGYESDGVLIVEGNKIPIHKMAKCVDELKAIDPRKLKEEPEFTALDCRAKAILLDKIVESNPVVSLATNHVKPSRAVSKARVSEIPDKLTSSAGYESDGVIIVEDNKIPIHKMHLAMYSEYFKRLFFGEFKEKDQCEIVLEEVKHADILELLSVVYPCADPVWPSQTHAMKVIVERCKKTLKSSKKIKRAVKLWLAQRYNFPDLQIKYANEYKKVEDVKNLKAEPEYELLDDETRSLIFDSITS